MNISIPEEELRQMVQEECDKSIRKRIREMQGNYTSKGYLEDMMRQILWSTLTEKIPNLESYVCKKIDEAVEEKKQLMKVPSKEEIINAVVERLSEE